MWKGIRQCPPARVAVAVMAGVLLQGCATDGGFMGGPSPPPELVGTQWEIVKIETDTASSHPHRSVSVDGRVTGKRLQTLQALPQTGTRCASGTATRGAPASMNAPAAGDPCAGNHNGDHAPRDGRYLNHGGMARAAALFTLNSDDDGHDTTAGRNDPATTLGDYSVSAG